MSRHYNEPVNRLLKRANNDSPIHLSVGSIVAIVIGVIVIVFLSIACCCPCWKKGGARPCLMNKGRGEENVGNEMGGINELDADGTRVHEALAEDIPPPMYEERSGGQMGVVEMPTKLQTVVVKREGMR